MNKLKRYFRWLCRIGYCRGFGVQSPSAYRFIRYVINEHYPYYAYSDLRSELPDVSWLERMRMELYFRIANFRQASTWLCYGGDTALLKRYVGCGCNASAVRSVQTKDVGDRKVEAECSDRPVEVALIRPVEGSEDFLTSVLQHSDMGTLILVEDIYDSPSAKKMWETLISSPRVSVCYDLYYLGIAFTDTDRYKTSYIVNF